MKNTEWFCVEITMFTLGVCLLLCFLVSCSVSVYCRVSKWEVVHRPPKQVIIIGAALAILG